MSEMKSAAIKEHTMKMVVTPITCYVACIECHWRSPTLLDVPQALRTAEKHAGRVWKKGDTWLTL